MKNELKAPFLNFPDTINLDKLNKLISMKKWEEESVQNAKIAISPTLYKTPTQEIDNLEHLDEIICYTSKRLQKTMYKTETGKELMALADKYNIPYDRKNKSNIDWVELTELVEKYEYLLEQADECGVIDYNIKDYDPVFLSQLIEDKLFEGIQERRDLNSYYYSTRI